MDFLNYWIWRPYVSWYMTEDYIKYVADMIGRFYMRHGYNIIYLRATYKRIQYGKKVYTVQFKVHNNLKTEEFENWLATLKDAWESVKDLGYMD